MEEALTPFARASLANWLFQASKPAEVLPHCAAPASPAVHTSATKAATATVLNWPPVVIQNSPDLGPSRPPTIRPHHGKKVAVLPGKGALRGRLEPLA